MARFIAVVGSMILCVALGRSTLGQVLPAATTKTEGGQRSAISSELHALFVRLDALGREKVKDARFVELHLSNADKPKNKAAAEAWLSDIACPLEMG